MGAVLPATPLGSLGSGCRLPQSLLTWGVGFRCLPCSFLLLLDRSLPRDHCPHFLVISDSGQGHFFFFPLYPCLKFWHFHRAHPCFSVS